MEKFPEFWREITELSVPIGTLFTCYKDKTIYKIESVEDNVVQVSWGYEGKLHKVGYYIEEVNKFFREGEWKKVDEAPKDYEILKLYANNNLFEHIKDNKWRRITTKDEIYYNLEVGKPYGATPLEIYTIKRLSDGVVFTVGDNIGGFSYTNRVLEAIKPTKTGRTVIFRTCYGTSSLKDIYHSKKEPLFTTSTEKAAKNYILCNKPVLSFNDVWNCTNNKSSDNSYIIISKKELKDLAKSKL